MTIEIPTNGAFAALSAAPGPAKIRFFDRLRAWFAGRRDAHRIRPTGDGQFAYTRGLLAAAQLIEARIAAELNRQVEAVDVRIAGNLATIRSLRDRAALDSADEQPTRSEPSTSPAALRAARAARARRTAAHEAAKQIEVHEQKLDMLLVARTRVHDLARALAGTYAARYETLCAVHRRSWETRTARLRRKDALGHIDGVGETLQLPTYVSAQPWSGADLPLPKGVTESHREFPADESGTDDGPVAIPS
jgi:hypothetical protein